MLTVDLHQLISDQCPNAVKASEIKNFFGRKVAIVCPPSPIPPISLSHPCLMALSCVVCVLTCRTRIIGTYAELTLGRWVFTNSWLRCDNRMVNNLCLKQGKLPGSSLSEGCGWCALEKWLMVVTWWGCFIGLWGLLIMGLNRVMSSMVLRRSWKMGRYTPLSTAIPISWILAAIFFPQNSQSLPLPLTHLLSFPHIYNFVMGDWQW